MKKALLGNIAKKTDMDIGKIMTDLLTEKEELNEDDCFIVNATPLALTSNTIEDQEIVNLTWLCKTKSEKLIIINSTYKTDCGEIEKEIFKTVPFYFDNVYLSNKVVHNLLVDNLPFYVTDLNFSINNDKEFTFNCIADGCKQITFYTNNTTFICFSFIDNYIRDNIINNHDLTLAVINGVNNNASDNIDLVFVDKIDSVLKLVKLDGTSVGVVFKAVSTGQESDLILAPFNIGIKFKKSKFKGSNIKKIENEYLKDKDQYISSFVYYTRIDNFDKEFLVIYAKNKDNHTKLFFLSYLCVSDLENMIKDF